MNGSGGRPAWVFHRPRLRRRPAIHSPMPRRQVVISGIGAVSALGVGIQPLWDGLCTGRSGVKPVSAFDASGFACRLAAEMPAEFAGAKDFVPKSYRKSIKVMARDIELAVAAAKLAVEDARLTTRGTLPEDSAAATTYPNARLGCSIGAGLIAAEADEMAAALSTAKREDSSVDLRAWGTDVGADGVRGAGAMNNLPPLWMLKYLPNMLACHVTIIHGAEGPSNTITAIEASGLLSIGESTRVIQRGSATACFAGGAEAPINLFRFTRMELLQRLAPTPEGVSVGDVVRPWDERSKGQVLGEGGGLLILEEKEAALARGAKVYAEIGGFGAAQSEPTSEGACWLHGGLDVAIDEGVRFAVENALDDAGITPDDVDAIVPHGSGVWAMDRGERGALAAVFGQRLGSVPVVTLVPALGDCLAGQGGLATAVAAMIIREQRVPGGSGPIRNVLVCTGSLGGQSAACVLRNA